MAVAGVLRTEAQQARAGGQHSPIFLGIATLRFLNVGIQARCVGVMVCGRSVRLGDKALATDLSASWGRFADSQWSLGESGVGRFNRALPPTPARASAGSAARAGPSPCSCRGVFDGDERQAGQLDALDRCDRESVNGRSGWPSTPRFPGETPRYTRWSACSSNGRSAPPPDSSSSRRHRAPRAPCISPQLSISSGCTAGEMYRPPAGPDLQPRM
jgi:hypothetical protein